MNRIVATMDDLPELPFEKVLSYLNLEDRLKARAVSCRWYNTINRFKVKTLCISKHPSGLVMGKSRWISGTFAQNFISSSRFGSFFNTFSSTILSNLKHLRICDLHLNTEDNGTSFVPTLNLFSQLEELDLILFTHPSAASDLGGEVELNLPMLTNIHLEHVRGIDQLTLEAPRLKRVKLLACSRSLKLKLVHADSVEWLVSHLAHVEVKNLKSLKYLYCGRYSEIDATFLFSLEQLKEIHLLDNNEVSELFEQKQRYGRTNLKIYLGGFLLDGPSDPAIDSFFDFKEFFVHLAKNPSRLADQIPLWDCLSYKALEDVAPESAINIVNRLTDLNAILAESSFPVQDVQRFLNLLKNSPNIVNLKFSSYQPQELFDWLPEHSAVQFLFLDRPVFDLRFLLRLEHLILLDYLHQITPKVVRKAFEELQILRVLQFKHHNQKVNIVRDPPWSVLIGEKKTPVADLNAAIQLIFGQNKKKRNKRR